MSFDDKLSNSSTSQQVLVTTKDGDQFHVAVSLLRQCKALALPQNETEAPVALTVAQISTPIFKKVLEWLKEHAENKMSFDDHLKNNSTNQRVLVTTKDGDQFHVAVSLLRQCKALALPQNETEAPVALTVAQISTPIFKKILEWLKDHADSEKTVIQEDPVTRERIWFNLSSFEKNFFEEPIEELIDLLNAANYLDLQSMYLYGCQAIAARLKDKSPEEIRELFGSTIDDLTEEEKEKIRNQPIWLNY